MFDPSSNLPVPKMRVLHICNWYPNRINPHEAPFIRRHVEALNAHCENVVWHIRVKPKSGKWGWSTRGGEADRTLFARVPTARSLVIEWATLVLVTCAWLTRKRRVKYDLVNIHITYPLAIKLQWLRRLFGVPIVLTEHWSVYHYSFRSASKGLERTRALFSHGAPLICVSRSLLTDIELFSGHKQEHVAIIDDVAEERLYHFEPGGKPQEGRFLAISGWSPPKRPDLLIGLMTLLRDAGVNAQLRIGGDGPQLKAVRAAIAGSGLGDRVTLLGRLSPEEVAQEMRQAHAFLHSSEYETYSAVCAESLCCGTPVIASDVGGIGEYLAKAPGSVLIPVHDPQAWKEALMAHWAGMLAVDRRAVSDYMLARASMESVGERYFNFLRQVAEERG